MFGISNFVPIFHKLFRISNFVPMFSKLVRVFKKLFIFQKIFKIFGKYFDFHKMFEFKIILLTILKPVCVSKNILFFPKIIAMEISEKRFKYITAGVL